MNVIDASCQDVIKTHDLIKDKLKLGYEILYIGKVGHPEAEGAISINSHKIHLITQKEDILKMNPQKKYIITNQTTMSLYDVYELCEFAKNTLPYVEIAKETCTATKIRQEAIKNIDDDIDIVFQDLNITNLKGKTKAAVSSGASTPTYLTNQVISFLEQFDENNPETHVKPSIEKEKILDEQKG